MADPADLGQLKTNEWEHLQDVADRLEQAWSQGHSVELSQFLPPGGHALRAIILRELIKTDLELRWQRGQVVGLEYYLEKFPELGTASTLPPELIYEEYRVRQFYGDKPELSVYQARFPAQYAELQRLQSSLGFKTPSPRATKPAPAAEPVNRQQQLLPVGGGYKLIRRIGSGGFGEVWQAEAPGGIAVAVKLIFRPMEHDEAQRELHSLELIKGLRHPFLIQTQAYWSFEDRLYIVMELADGSLRDRLKQCRAQGLTGIPATELMQYFREAAEAVDFLHRQHVLHRDIKPENILLLQNHAKLADFGLARVQESQRLASATGSGTPLYMAPEIWGGKVSTHSDQYSLALTYAELRLDRRLFSGKDLMQIMLDHLEGTPNLDPLAEAEQQVIRKALSKDPDQRYPSCQAFIQALDQVVTAGRAQIALAASTRLEGSSTATRPDPSPAGAASEDLLYATTTRSPTPAPVSDAYATRLPAAGSEPNSASAMRAETLSPPASRPAWRDKPAERQPAQARWRWAALLAGLAVLPVVVVVAVIYWPVPPPGPDPKSPPDPVTPVVNTTSPTGKEVAWKPEDSEKGKEAKILTDLRRKNYYDHIVKVKNGQRIDFRLVAKQKERDPETFYVMENKVWNDLFHVAVNDAAYQSLLKTYEAPGSLWKVQKEWLQSVEDRDKDWGRLPATQVTVIEAYCFAVWLGGNLPTARQWNKASGYYEENKGAGPFRPPPTSTDKRQIAITEQGHPAKPWPVGTARDDVSPFECRDMSGNGMEWTRDVRGGDQFVPARSGRSDERISLRGQTFNSWDPLFYKDWNDKLVDEQWDVAASDITFRVVVEPP